MPSLRIVTSDSHATDEARFRAVFETHFRRVLGYALRRAANTSDAADAASETMLTAWRRLCDVPPEPETLPWLDGVARKVLANQRRSLGRDDRFSQRLQLALNDAFVEPSDDHPDVRSALQRLDPDAREIVRLATWESLTGDEIACVLGISPAAARARLHRARLRLRAVLTEMGEP